MFLSQEDFTQVIDNTPLVSIDLVVLNSRGEALLGERKNRPAKGFWFVPGGRIFKNESIENAFKRLTAEELGIELDINAAELLGPFNHFYDDCVFGESPSTHYVAIAYKLIVDLDIAGLPDQQHGAYRWMPVADLLALDEVHLHTKWYF